MIKKRRPASDPEIRQKVLEAIRTDAARDQQQIETELAKLEERERSLTWAKSDYPEHRPIERELLAAYVNRSKSLIEFENRPSSVSRRDALLKEIEELGTLLWGPKWIEDRSVVQIISVSGLVPIPPSPYRNPPAGKAA